MTRRPVLSYGRRDVHDSPRPTGHLPRWALLGWGVVIACAVLVLILLLFPELVLLVFPLYGR